jgi:hypothetical protein
MPKSNKISPKKCHNESIRIDFKYSINESITEPVPSDDAIPLNGWAPAYNVKNGKSIGYITFSYYQQKKYDNQGTQNGYFNILNLCFVFDRYQNRNKDSKTFSSQIQYESGSSRQRIPKGLHISSLKSNSFDISDESYLSLNVKDNGDRFYKLHIKC